MLVVVVLHSLLFDVIPHPSVSYRRVFTPILYCQPSSSQSDLRQFHFNISGPFLHSFIMSATVLIGHIFYPQAFFTLCSFSTILSQPTFIKVSLGAGSSSSNFAGLCVDPQNTDPPIYLFDSQQSKILIFRRIRI